MIWSNVAQTYMHSFELARLEGAPLSQKSVGLKTLDTEASRAAGAEVDAPGADDGLNRRVSAMRFSVCPTSAEGYCTDDNARAFILAVLIGELMDDAEEVRSLASTSAAFLHYAFNESTGRFHNHMSFDRQVAG